MSTELMLGALIGGLLFIIAMVVRRFMRPIETEISPYVPPSRSAGNFDSAAPVSYSDFSLTVGDVFSIKGRGTVVTGKVISGTIRTGQRVHVSFPDSTEYYETTVKGLEAFNKKMDMAQTGDFIGILLADLTKEEIKAGMQISVLN